MTTSSMALSWTIRSHFFDRMVLSSHGRVRCSGITQDGCSSWVWFSEESRVSQCVEAFLPAEWLNLETFLGIESLQNMKHKKKSQLYPR